MPNPYFNFKQFTVRHDKCAMKVGTDGVLLGTWATVGQNIGNATPFQVLDVGTGTGLIALIVAQRNPHAHIDAMDVDEQACEQATENINKSPFRDRIKVIRQSFTNYVTEKKYDLIISNPPFFNNSLKSPDPKRNLARHNDSLPLKQLIKQALTMLTDNGRVALILPIQQAEELDFLIATHRLYTIRRTDILPVEGASPKRFLTEITTTNPLPDEQPLKKTLTLETKNRQRTEEYNVLTKDFYLD